MAGEAILNNRYKLVAQQGSGGMSVIYRAVDLMLGRNVAVKILRPSLTQDPAFLEKFHQEARAIANLTHPNIVTVFDVGRDGQTNYIVMELVDGLDLKKIIKSEGAMPVERVLDLSVQIAAGLGYAHRSGLVHADVKPQNILVTTDGKVKVTDFGIAQALQDTQPQQRLEVVWGSPHYFAPEQARGEHPTPAADVYAIGIVMFEMLTGRLPYGGTSQQELAMAHIRDRIPMVTEFVPSIPESLARIVFKLMSKEPTGRYNMGGQLEQVLLEYRNKARDVTMRNMQAAPPPMPPTSPSQAVQPPQSTPGVTLPPAAPPASSEPTVRFSAAPAAPQPYNPRQGAAPIQAPQPLEQRYTVGGINAPIPAPQQQPPQGHIPMPPRGDSGMYGTLSKSQPIDYDEPQGVDYVTIALAFFAFIAVVGLCPLYLAVIAAS